MKKLLTLILSLILVLSFAACKNETAPVSDDDILSDSQTVSDGDEALSDGGENEDDTQIKNEDNTKNETGNKVQDKTQNSETVKKPEETTPSQPASGTQTPSEPEAPKTVGNLLLAEFKSKAASSTALSIAQALCANEIVPYSLAAMEIEPGFLQGFDNAEIKGFKEGAVFMPMIGTHPFIGYVFVLDDGADTQAFISTLRQNANLRWNICTAADEMVTGSVGNKVFFVMCPTSFEQE